MKRIITRIALASVVAAAASVCDAASYSGSQSAQVLNGYYNRSYAAVYKSGSYATPLYRTATTYGNFLYSAYHPYTNTNYQHWLYDYTKGDWDYIYTVKFTNK